MKLKTQGGMSKRKAKVDHLINWYFGNFCARCGFIDMEDKKYGRDCQDKLHLLKELLPEEMTHKEFINFVRNGTTFCRPIPREFHECPICKALGVPQRKW